jgi:hypothetical protein
MNPALTVEKWPGSAITVYRLGDQAPGTLIAWVRRLVNDLEEVRLQQRTLPPERVQPHRILHDLRLCGMPSALLLSNLSVGLSAGRDLNIQCAIVAQDARTAKVIRRLINVPDVDGTDTPVIYDPAQVWGPGAVVRFTDRFEEAVTWLGNASSPVRIVACACAQAAR